MRFPVKVIKESDKATLVEIAPEKQIWLPKAWISAVKQREDGQQILLVRSWAKSQVEDKLDDIGYYIKSDEDPPP